MRALGLRGLILLGSMLLGLNAATAADAPKPLSGTEIKAVLGGSTASGTTAKGETWVEYYVPGGGIHGLWQEKNRYTGSWRVDGDKFCAKYPDTPDSNYCAGIAVEGHVLYYLKDDGSIDADGGPYKLDIGNPEHL